MSQETYGMSCKASFRKRCKAHWKHMGVMARAEEGSDGCTGVPDLRMYICCAQHDRVYRDAKKFPNWWNKVRADLRLARCGWRQRHYLIGPLYAAGTLFNPYAWGIWFKRRWRWLGAD